MNSTIAVRYFAVLRDVAGKSSEDIPWAAGQSAGGVYTLLAERYGFPLALGDIRVAINDEFVSAHQPLNAGDSLVFIPPVSGG